MLCATAFVVISNDHNMEPVGRCRRCCLASWIDMGSLNASYYRQSTMRYLNWVMHIWTPPQGSHSFLSVVPGFGDVSIGGSYCSLSRHLHHRASFCALRRCGAADSRIAFCKRKDSGRNPQPATPLASSASASTWKLRLETPRLSVVNLGSC